MLITNTLPKFGAGLLSIILSAVTTFSQDAKQIRVDFKDTTLKNGLRVITVQDNSAPVLSLSVTYNVGSRDERRGRTGFAHLFEHMMFQGSENVGQGEHPALIINNGGTANGFTTWDRTQYYETLPANQLELALFLEADRMRSLAITKANVDNQRSVVKEERRELHDNTPYGKSEELHNKMIFENFPYQHSIIGSMQDLEAASVEDARQFFKTYYAPNNAVLTVVGDFKTQAALARVRQHFESIPRQAAPPAVEMTEPAQKSERRATIESSLARLARVDVAFKIPAGNTREFYALQALSNALLDGESSRLHQKLVNDRQLSTYVVGFASERRGPGVLYILATVAPGKEATEVEAAIDEEIEKIKTIGIPDQELSKVKNKSLSRFINRLHDPLNIANRIGEDTVFYNDPNLINSRLDKINRVTAEQVKQAANRYLQPTNRAVIVTSPKPIAAAATEAGANN